MTHGTFFLQDCPTCGRALHIRVEHLGRQLTCPHCRGKVRARDPEDSYGHSEGLGLLQRADELLNQTRIA